MHYSRDRNWFGFNYLQFMGLYSNSPEMAFNQWGAGSSPARLIFRFSHFAEVKTSAFLFIPALTIGCFVVRLVGHGFTSGSFSFSHSSSEFQYWRRKRHQNSSISRLTFQWGACRRVIVRRAPPARVVPHHTRKLVIPLPVTSPLSSSRPSSRLLSVVAFRDVATLKNFGAFRNNAQRPNQRSVLHSTPSFRLGNCD